MERIIFVFVAFFFLKCKLKIPITLAAILLLTASVSAGDVTLLEPLATNFSAHNKVIELSIPIEMDEKPFAIIWNRADGRQIIVWLTALEGIHVYDMRNYDGWGGHIIGAATNLKGVRGSVREATLLDEIDIFLAPERIIMSTINLLQGHTLFRLSWDNILLFIFCLLLLSFYLATKKLVVSAVFGFSIVWGIFDTRNIYDHLMIINKIERRKLVMPPMTESKIFADRASKIIGDKSWAQETLDGGLNNFIKYRLAEHPYACSSLQEPPAFIITQQPKDREIVLEYGSYYLVKGGQS